MGVWLLRKADRLARHKPRPKGEVGGLLTLGSSLLYICIGAYYTQRFLRCTDPWHAETALEVLAPMFGLIGGVRFFTQLLYSTWHTARAWRRWELTRWLLPQHAYAPAPSEDGGGFSSDDDDDDDDDGGPYSWEHEEEQQSPRSRLAHEISACELLLVTVDGNDTPRQRRRRRRPGATVKTPVEISIEVQETAAPGLDAAAAGGGGGGGDASTPPSPHAHLLHNARRGSNASRRSSIGEALEAVAETPAAAQEERQTRSAEHSRGRTDSLGSDERGQAAAAPDSAEERRRRPKPRRRHSVHISLRRASGNSAGDGGSGSSPPPPYEGGEVVVVAAAAAATDEAQTKPVRFIAIASRLRGTRRCSVDFGTPLQAARPAAEDPVQPCPIFSLSVDGPPPPPPPPPLQPASSSVAHPPTNGGHSIEAIVRQNQQRRRRRRRGSVAALEPAAAAAAAAAAARHE